MSYDIELIDPVTGNTLELDAPHHMRGGTYALGGTTRAHLNVTYNYSPQFCRVFPPRATTEAERAEWGRNEFNGTGVAGSVVGQRKIVIDRLGYPDDAQLVVLLLRELGNLIGRILRVVAADIEKVADIVRLEYLEHALEVLLLLQLVTAGAEGGSRRMAKRANLLLRFRREIDQVLLEEAEHTIQRAVNLLDAFMVKRLRDDARDAGIDNGRGATGLAHQNISYEFSHD